MGVLARNYEKIYFRENVVVTKNLPPYFPIKSNTIKKKEKISFSALKKKSTVENSKSAHSSSWHLFQALRGILESLIAAFSRKHHTCTSLLFHFFSYFVIRLGLSV